MNADIAGLTSSQQKVLDDLNESLRSSKLKELKEDCKAHGLKVSGTKAVLQERLRQHFLESQQKPREDDFQALSDEDLVTALSIRSLPGRASGLSRKAMEELFKNDIELHKALLKNNEPQAIARALEDASNDEESDLAKYLSSRPVEKKPPKKKFDLQVLSLSELLKGNDGSIKTLKPTKHTAGGAPSVTADVLRDLAGDPFAEPPKRGKVGIRLIVCVCVLLGTSYLKLLTPNLCVT